MNKQEFIKNYIDDALEYGCIFNFEIPSQEKLMTEINGIKIWFRVNKQEKPDWIGMDITIEILDALKKEVELRKKGSE